jgi:hypothetical protein
MVGGYNKRYFFQHGWQHNLRIGSSSNLGIFAISQCDM